MLAEAGLTAERVGAGRWAPCGANGFGSPGIGSCVGGPRGYAVGRPGRLGGAWLGFGKVLGQGG